MDRRYDHRLNILLFVTGLLVVGSLIVALFAVPAVYESRDNSDRVAQGNDLSSCRSQLHSVSIDQPNTDLQLALATAQVVTLDGLAATVVKDQIAEDRALSAKAQAETQIESARTELDAGTMRYRAAVVASRKDPTGFLHRYCPA